MNLFADAAVDDNDNSQKTIKSTKKKAKVARKKYTGIKGRINEGTKRHIYTEIKSNLFRTTKFITNETKQEEFAYKVLDAIKLEGHILQDDMDEDELDTVMVRPHANW